MNFLWFNLFAFVSFHALYFASRTSHSLVLARHRHSELLWVGGARNMHPPHAFVFLLWLALGQCLQVEENRLKKTLSKLYVINSHILSLKIIKIILSPSPMSVWSMQKCCQDVGIWLTSWHHLPISKCSLYYVCLTLLDFITPMSKLQVHGNSLSTLPQYTVAKCCFYIKLASHEVHLHLICMLVSN